VVESVMANFVVFDSEDTAVVDDVLLAVVELVAVTEDAFVVG